MINKANFSQPSVPIGQIDTHLYSQTQSSETCLESGQYGGNNLPWPRRSSLSEIF